MLNLKNSWITNFTFLIISLSVQSWASAETALEHVLNNDAASNSYSISRSIKYGFTVRNSTSQLVENAELWVYGPVKKTSTQQCMRINTSHPSNIITDALNNQVVHFIFDKIPPYGSLSISIQADLLLSETPVSLGDDDLDRSLIPEKFIETDHPETIKKAVALQASSRIQTIEKTFKWVSTNINYAGYISKDRGALYALREKKGDCTEFMYLFAALCRANEIPVRCMGGYICEGNSVLKPYNYHNWAEFYEKGTWWLADPQNKRLRERPYEYIAMRIIGISDNNSMNGFHRYRYSGDGLRVKMDD